MDLQPLARLSVRLFGIILLINGLTDASYGSSYAQAWVYFGMNGFGTITVCCYAARVLLFLSTGVLAMRWSDPISARLLPSTPPSAAAAVLAQPTASLEQHAVLLVRIIAIFLVICLIYELLYLPRYVHPLLMRLIPDSAKIGAFWWLMRVLIFGIASSLLYLKAGKVAGVLALRNDETMPR